MECRFCRKFLTTQSKGNTCEKCETKIKKEGYPTTCLYCGILGAFGKQTLCRRCLHSAYRYNLPSTCTQCGLPCAFQHDEKDDSRKCWLCKRSNNDGADRRARLKRYHSVDVTKMSVDHDGLEPIYGKLPRVDQGANCSNHIVATMPINDTDEILKHLNNAIDLHKRAKEEQMTAMTAMTALKEQIVQKDALLLANQEEMTAMTALKEQMVQKDALLLANQEEMTALKEQIVQKDALLLANQEEMTAMTALKEQIVQKDALLLANQEEITTLKNKLKIITDVAQQDGNKS